MGKALASWVVLLLSLFGEGMASDEDGSHCNCDEERFLFIDIIMEVRRVSDLLIAVAYFAILIELIFFVSCSAMKFKLALVQFIAFIVLCGMNNFLSFWSYGSHSFQLMVAVTIFKCLTALVSSATVVSLLSFIPMLLKVTVREFMLRKETRELQREITVIKKQTEASLQFRILTREIRKSLDRHTILQTTLVELPKALEVETCAVWMPNAAKTEMELIHELSGGGKSIWHKLRIPIDDPDVRAIEGINGVKILNPESPLGVDRSRGRGRGEVGCVAAVGVPLLRVSDFNGGTHEMVPGCAAIITLVHKNGRSRSWSEEELDIVKAIADQVAVALSHAWILEELKNIQEKLIAQNSALQEAKEDAVKATQVKKACQMALTKCLKKPVDSVLGLSSSLQDFKFTNCQRLVVDAMVKSCNAISTSIRDAMDATSAKKSGKLSLDIKPFQLHSTIKEAACIFKCISACRGCEFEIRVDNSLQNPVIGDEKRVFQVILHNVGNFINASKIGSYHILHVYPACHSCKKNIQECCHEGKSPSNAFTFVRFDMAICHSGPHRQKDVTTFSRLDFRKSMSFGASRKLVQIMHGDLWVTSNPEGLVHTMALELRLEVQPESAIQKEMALR